MLALIIKTNFKKCLCSDNVKLLVVKLIIYVLDFRKGERGESHVFMSEHR